LEKKSFTVIIGDDMHAYVYVNFHKKSMDRLLPLIIIVLRLLNNQSFISFPQTQDGSLEKGSTSQAW
jgi:hypothetical protein